MKKALAAALAASALGVVAPPQALAQQPTRCLAAYQDRLFTSSTQPVVEYEPPETVRIYPGHAVDPVLYIADATLDYVDCVLP